ncbi:double-stranded RNA-binding protein [Trifolium repens]|nr:double-stranded RNA-binding protein [Trifolium repens]
MYKMKLQELCHRRRWSLPEYYAMNIDGPPHNPIFKAYVFVNGVTFTSSDTFNSSKEAHNQAAMKAFLNFSSPPSCSSIPKYEYGLKEEVEAAKPKPKENPVPSQSQFNISDTYRSRKLQLQNYARKNDHDPTVVTVKTERLPHDIHYKANVVIDGKSFENPTLFNTIKEAEQAAAKIVDIFQQASDESCSFKSLLHELTQREDFSLPTYKTTKIGPPHMPTFFSTVEVESLEFHGKASSSRKQAEQDAAKIAYTALKECGLHMYAAFSSSIKENQAEQSTHESDFVKSKQKLNFEDDEPLDEEIFCTNIKVNKGMHNESFPLPPNKKIKMSNMSPSSSSPKSYQFSLSDTDDTSPGHASGSTSIESRPIAVTKAKRTKKPPSWLEDYY